MVDLLNDANIADFMPLAQTLLTVVEGVSKCKPEYITACLVGAWPMFALHTFPINSKID